MLTYALGRGLEESDRCAVDRIVKDLEANEYRFSVLVRGIVAERSVPQASVRDGPLKPEGDP